MTIPKSLRPITAWMVAIHDETCKACVQLEPKWSEAAAEIRERSGGQVQMAKIDASQNLDLVALLGGAETFPTILVRFRSFLLQKFLIFYWSHDDLRV